MDELLRTRDKLTFFPSFSKVNNANAFDTKGRTALHLAALNGHQRILETLVKNHALVCIHDGTESKFPIGQIRKLSFA